MKPSATVLAKAEKIKLVIFDVDGVLTDGRLYFDYQGNELKVFHVQDGLGIKLLQENGIQVAIISGRTATAVASRLGRLGVKHIFQGQENKLPVFKKLLEQLKLTPEQVAYVGDDLPDISPMNAAGFSIAVANAQAFVKENADWHTELTGGQGAVREVCNLILDAQGKLETVLKTYV